MSIPLILGLALLTYVSRAAALVLMPDPPDRLRLVLDRIPAPLFACLAVTSLIEEGSPASVETLCAAALALVAAPTRSILWVLIAGLVGYGLGALLLA